MKPEPTSIAICVITFLRPVGLARLLGSFSKLAFKCGPDPDLRIVVVDNDPAGSARPVAEQAAAQLAWPLTYAIEPQRGISFARNRAVALAAGCELLAFVDDDELAEPEWLDQLVAAQRAHDADVVAGPVAPVFDAPPPAWVLRGQFVGVRRFGRASRPTGTPIGSASSANLLVRRSALAGIPGPFHPAFALSGGSDILLTRQLARRGARMIWCDEASVAEHVPASRARAGWIIQRAYRVGNTLSRCDGELEPSARSAARRALRGGGLVALGLAGLLPALLGGRALAVRMLAYAARGAGILAGLAGHRYEEYQTIHGA